MHHLRTCAKAARVAGMVIESCGNDSPHVSNCSHRKPYGAPSRNRTGTPAINEAADFKSAVSTYFAIRATFVEAGAGIEPA